MLINQWETWGIFSKSWSEAHGATEATAMNATTPPYAGLHANGTGPFILVSHEPGVKTVWKKNPNWWDKPIGNVDEVVFTPIPNAATRVAALLSGEIDWMDPVPLNDQARVNANPGTQVLAGPGGSDDLPRHGPVPRRTRPFQRQGQESVQGRSRAQGVLSGDRRGRDQQEGHARAGDADGADDRALAVFARRRTSSDFRSIPPRRRSCSPRPAIPTDSRCRLDCPNDRYVNDEQICQAVVGMLARVGIKVDLNAEPKSKFFAAISAAGGYDTSFYLLGWTPTTLESYNVFQYIMGCRDPKTNWGGNNVGGYCNPKVDELARQALQEPDEAKRDDDFARA